MSWNAVENDCSTLTPYGYMRRERAGKVGSWKYHCWVGRPNVNGATKNKQTTICLLHKSTISRVSSYLPDDEWEFWVRFTALPQVHSTHAGFQYMCSVWVALESSAPIYRIRCFLSSSLLCGYTPSGGPYIVALCTRRSLMRCRHTSRRIYF